MMSCVMTKKRHLMLNFLKDKSFTKQIIALSIPVAFQNLISAILNIFDQLMVGWLDPSIADYCLSAVLLANQIVFIFQIILFAVCNSTNIFLAQYTQNGKDSLIPQRVGVAFIVNMVLCLIMSGLCFFAPKFMVSLFNANVEYATYAQEFLKIVSISFIPMTVSITFGFVLRALKKLNVVLVGNLCGVVLNIILNYVLMFGKLGFEPMGLLGAAWGTVISRTVEAVIIVVGILICKYPVIASPKKMFYIDKEYNKQFFKVGFPILISEIMWVLSTSVYLYVYDKLPNSQVMLAGVNIAGSVERIITVAVIGIGVAAGVLISNVIGENNNEKLKTYANYCMQFAFSAGLVISVVTFACAFFAPSFFMNVSAEAANTGKILIIVYAATSILRTMSFMLVIGILRSGGDATYTMVSEAIITWAIGVPLVVVGGLVFKWNIYVLFTLTMFAELLKCVLYYFRVKSNKWVKLKT